MQISSFKEVAGRKTNADTSEHGGRNDIEFHAFGRITHIKTFIRFAGVDKGKPRRFDVLAVERSVVKKARTLKIGHIAHIIKSDIVAQAAVNGAPVRKHGAGIVQDIRDQGHFFAGEVLAAGVVVTLDDLAVLFHTELEPDAAVTGKDLFTGQRRLQF